MDKLTTERLHQYQKSFDARDDHQGDFRVDDVRAMVAELLSLRTDAGDEEVQKILDELLPVLPSGFPAGENKRLLLKLAGYAAAYRNELRSAREEIKRWEKRAEWIGSCYKDDANGKSLVIFDGTKSATYPDDAKTIAKMIDNAMTEGCDLSEGLLTTKQQIQSLQSQIATLAAERDEAKSGNDFLRQEIEDWKEANRRAEAERKRPMSFEYSDPRDNIHSECELEVHRLKEEIATLTAERDEAREFREIVTLFCQGEVKGLRINYFNGFVVTRSDGVADQSWDGPDLLEVLREMKTSLTEQWEETI